MWSGLAILALIWGLGSLPHKALITPIGPLLEWPLIGAGFLIGIRLGQAIVSGPLGARFGRILRIMVILAWPLVCMVAGDCVAWRVGEWIRFPFSNAAFVPASYPIVYVDGGRSRNVFGIDPYGVGDTTIEVPREQFDAYKAHAGDYCITVMQRRSAEGAVEILDPGVSAHPAPAKLTPCPSHYVKANVGQWLRQR